MLEVLYRVQAELFLIIQLNKRCCLKVKHLDEVSRGCYGAWHSRGFSPREVADASAPNAVRQRRDYSENYPNQGEPNNNLADSLPPNQVYLVCR